MSNSGEWLVFPAMSSIESDLAEILRILKDRGLDTDVAISHIGGDWRAEAVNPTGAVSLGESTGRFQNRPWTPNDMQCAKTASQAVAELLEVVRKGEFNG